MQPFQGKIEAGVWVLVPRIGGQMRPCPDQAGRYGGIMTVSSEVARALCATTGTSPRLRTDAGACLRITVVRWWPLGSNAMVEFDGLDEPIPRPGAVAETV